MRIGPLWTLPLLMLPLAACTTKYGDMAVTKKAFEAAALELTGYIEQTFGRNPLHA